MNTRKPNEPMIWAHRGRNRIAPENTMSAFVAALDAGDKGIELDVALSADYQPIVIHDDSVDRTTDGSGVVAAMSFKELRSLDAGAWFDSRFAAERLPDLRDVLAEVRDRVLLNIEFKSSAWNENPDISVDTIVMEMVARSGTEETIVYSSFSRKCLERVRRLDADARIGVLAHRGEDIGDVMLFAQKIGAYSIHPNTQDMKKAIRSGLNEWKGFVYPYTVGSRKNADQMDHLGADGYFADLPF
ncbi:MAG: glycerophosphodiester phosphodiesterase family protein [Spirochaetaceae bacterium]|nr:glycerophosphodiester phosphodiesterase family protein [Spirochaetaceae bacterium]